MVEYKGELEGFPQEVVERMLEHQVEQNNKRDVSVFEKYTDRCKGKGGFTWASTIEGREFWKDVISYAKFEVFFGKYPKEYKILELW